MMRNPILFVFLSVVLVSCAALSLLTRTSTPSTEVVVTSVRTDSPTVTYWKNRLKSCITELSFLSDLLPELDKYKGNADSIAVSISILPPAAGERGCITLPEDLYPRAKREFIKKEGNAYLGYISNWEPMCGGIHAGPYPDNCTGDGYEGGGTGAVILRAQSATPDIPDLIIQFTMK